MRCPISTKMHFQKMQSQTQTLCLLHDDKSFFPQDDKAVFVSFSFPFSKTGKRVGGARPYLGNMGRREK